MGGSCAPCHPTLTWFGLLLFVEPQFLLGRNGCSRLQVGQFPFWLPIETIQQNGTEAPKWGRSLPNLRIDVVADGTACASASASAQEWLGGEPNAGPSFGNRVFEIHHGPEFPVGTFASWQTVFFCLPNPKNHGHTHTHTHARALELA